MIAVFWMPEKMVFNILRENDFQSRVLHPVQLSIKHERRIKICNKGLKKYIFSYWKMDFAKMNK